MNLDKLKDSIKDVLREEGSTEKYKVRKCRTAIYKKPADWTYASVGYHANMMRLRRSMADKNTLPLESKSILSAMANNLMAIPLESSRRSNSFVYSKDEKKRVTRELRAAMERARRMVPKELGKSPSLEGELADMSAVSAARIFALAGYRIINIKNTE